MFVLNEALQRQLEYDAWANRRLLEAAGGLAPEQACRDFATADKSVAGTLLHIYASGRLWFARVSGLAAPELALLKSKSLGDLQLDWPLLLEDWKGWAARLAPDAGDRILQYTDTRGTVCQQALWQIVLHVVNHGTHHRGQISGFLRAMGHTPPVLDLAFFNLKQGK